MSRERDITASFEALLEDLAETSQRGYKNDWAIYRAWLASEDLDVLKVTPKDIKHWQSWMAEEGKAKATRGRALSVVRAVYSALVNDELLTANPARESKIDKKGKLGKKITWLEEEPLKHLLAFDGPLWADKRDRMCVQLLVGTGGRRSEVARMKVEDFNEDGVTGIVKGGTEKTRPVPDWLRREIKTWCKFADILNGPILPRGPHRPKAVSDGMIYLIVQRVSIAVGIPIGKISPHGLRRTLATLAKRRGRPLSHIQQQLGHASQSTTEGYIHGSEKIEQAPGEWMAEFVKDPNDETEE